MKMYSDELPPADLAARALDLALVGRDLSPGPTARNKLSAFALDLLADRGFDAAYHGLGELLDRADAQGMIAADNATDAQAGDDATDRVVMSQRTITSLMADANQGDAGARAELDRRAAALIPGAAR